MYIYFDTNGTIKEVINDESIRRGSSDYNKIYCYLEGNPDIDDIWYLQKNPDGTLTNEVSFVDNVVTKAIPYDSHRDMKYFQDFEEYQFYVFTLSSSYLSQNGLVVATIRVAENNTLWALGELTFNVQENVIKDDNGITQSQYDYLLLAYASRTLNATTGQDLDTLIEQKVETNVGEKAEQLEDAFEQFKEETTEDIDNRLNAQDEQIRDLGQLQPNGTATSSVILAKTSADGIWVATDNGHWYYWNGTQYVDGGVYQANINVDYNMSTSSINPVINEVIGNEFLQTKNYLKNYFDDNFIYYGLVVVEGSNRYVTKELPVINIKKNEVIHISFSNVTNYNSSSYICLVRFYDENDTLLEQTSILYNNYSNFAYTSHQDSSYCKILLAPAPDGALATGKAYYYGINIWKNDLTFNLNENIKYAPFDNFKQEYDSFINKYRPYNIRLKSSSYVNPVYLIDNHIFSCEKVNLVSNGIVTEGIEILCVPPIKNAWIYAKASRSFGTDFISRITITMDDNTTSAVRTFTSGETISIYIPENAVQIVFTFPICWSYDTILEENQEVEITDIDVWYEDGVKETIGKGDIVYKGYEKINLGLNEYHCKTTNIDKKTFAEWQEIIGDTSSITNNCQSMAIYNDYVFNFSALNDVYILSLTDSSYEYHANFPNSAHCNSAQFINVFYDENDDYPLLLISNCEINNNIDYNTLSVVRVIENNGTFTFTLVKTITFKDNSFKWGGSIVFDEAHNRFISMTNKNGAYNVFVNNPNIFLTFEAPNSWIDGVDETIENGELLFEIPHLVLQGFAIENNQLIFGAQIYNTDNYWKNKANFTGSSVFIMNMNGELKNILKVNRVEVEGVYVYKNELYCQSHLSISTNVNDECLWVDKYTF